jgi:glucose-6-phosphate 1-epimerase
MQPRVDFQKYGAQLIQNFPDQLFYVSPLGCHHVGCWRGGQPVIFPQFAGQGVLKKHGFARDVVWKLVAEERAHERHRVILARNFGICEFEGWPHEAALALDIECVPGSIRQTLEVRNTGHSEFSWTGGLHPYFAVSDLKSSTLSGLVGLPYMDSYVSGHDFVGPEEMRWNEDPCEKLFDGAPVLSLDAGLVQIELATSGFDQWMVWNPGREGAKAIADLPDEDWNKFVCIEPVLVKRPVTLKPGSKFVGKFDISFKTTSKCLEESTVTGSNS